jgi:hypothetical protein
MTDEICTCKEPITDSDLDIDGDDDSCWRCHKPILPPEEDPE